MLGQYNPILVVMLGQYNPILGVILGQDNPVIDLYKVNTAILPGVQNYWGERAAKQ